MCGHGDDQKLVVISNGGMNEKTARLGKCGLAPDIGGVGPLPLDFDFSRPTNTHFSNVHPSAELFVLPKFPSFNCRMVLPFDHRADSISVPLFLLRPLNPCQLICRSHGL